MWTRREWIAGGAALAAATRVQAGSPTAAKRAAIDGIALPAGFNGLLAYGKGGRLSHLRCAGSSDLLTGEEIVRGSRFRWGSCTKWITSVAVLRLVEQKRLALDAPVVSLLPSFRADTGGQVTLRHLLSNTSGIPDLLSRQLSSEPGLRTSTASPMDLIARFGGGDLEFAPGRGWAYAALNWVIVAAIVERVTGEAFEDAVQRLVLSPLRMRTAAFALEGAPPIPRMAVSYDRATPPQVKPAPAPHFVAATGNLAGTVDDALRAAHGIFHGPLLGAASRAALVDVRWQPQEYALGGRIHPVGGEPWAWETGKVAGYRTHIAHRLRKSETVVIFNTTDMDQSEIGSWAEKIALA